jgi:hypothetical protein
MSVRRRVRRSRLSWHWLSERPPSHTCKHIQICMFIQIQVLRPGQAYRHIFTAPSSVTSENTSEITTRRRDVATSLGLNGCVTPRSIAYTAIQVCHIDTRIYCYLTLSVQACLLHELRAGLEAGTCWLPFSYLLQFYCRLLRRY